jgi:hypothetical protein
MGEDKKLNSKEVLIRDNAMLKSKIAYSIGSLETVNYLLKNDDPEIIVKNMEHLKSTVSRILDDLKKDLF